MIAYAITSMSNQPAYIKDEGFQSLCVYENSMQAHKAFIHYGFDEAAYKIIPINVTKRSD